MSEYFLKTIQGTLALRDAKRTHVGHFLKEYHFKNEKIKNEFVLVGLAKINTLSGTNNSGKSRFMRNMIMLFRAKNENYFHRINLLNTTNAPTMSSMKLYKALLDNDISVVKNLFKLNFLSFENPIIHYYVNDVVGFLKEINFDTFKKQMFASGNLENRLIHAYDVSLDDNLLKKVIDAEIEMSKTLKLLEKIKPLYIPTLRGLRPFPSQEDPYKQRTMQDYGLAEDQIFTGLSIYKELQEHLLGTPQQRDLIRDYEAFLSESFFDGKPTFLVPRINSDVVYVKVGDKEERPIYDLGDGIQALIILTFPLFLRREEPYAVFIEEPETHLHPHWQRFFLKTIQNNENFKNHQFFFTSHSSIFISEPNASVYRVGPHTESEKTLVEHLDLNPKQLSLLSDLGYSASDLLQANFIIWVEGPSDFPFVRFFMEQLHPKYIENKDYVIMSYGGGTLFGLSKEDSGIDVFRAFKNINPYFVLIMDSDKEAEDKPNKEKQAHHERLEELLGEHFCLLAYREMENYVPMQLYKEVLAELNGIDINTLHSEHLDEHYGDRNQLFSDETSLNFTRDIKLPKEFSEQFFKIEDSKVKPSENLDASALLAQLMPAIQSKLKGISTNKLKMAEAIVDKWRENIASYPIPDKIIELFQKIEDMLKKACGANQEA